MSKFQNATISVDPKKILHHGSDRLYGIFIEDINFAIEGGLYPELVKNRAFSFGKLATYGHLHGWQVNAVYELLQTGGITPENPCYLSLHEAGSVENSGFLDGMYFTKGEAYDFSIFVKNYTGNLIAKIMIGDKTVGSTEIECNGSADWKQYKSVIVANETVPRGGKLCISVEGACDIAFVSLFTQNTYHGVKNGTRKDLTELLAKMKPSFIRFPGGCVVEGKTLESAYSWKDSIANGVTERVGDEVLTGSIYSRPMGIDIWTDTKHATAHPYYATYGMGFYEYFVLCEELNAFAIPVINAGLSCLIQTDQFIGTSNDCLDIESKEFAQYVQNALDLAEFCRGDETTKWGKVRIQMGHEKPFELKYMGIGNEQWTEEYYDRYDVFRRRFAEMAEINPEIYGNITFVVGNGASAWDRQAHETALVRGKEFGVKEYGIIDEHYYSMPNWFLANTHRYDSYDRNASDIFLGEYASRTNLWYSALAEAAFLTGIERNSDIVKMAAYAPVFGNGTFNHWLPDMIFYDGTKVVPSVNYEVQRLFATNRGHEVLDCKVETRKHYLPLSGRVGLGTWCSAAAFSNFKVTDNKTGKILQSGFTGEKEIKGGYWEFTDTTATQRNTEFPAKPLTGDVFYIGDRTWEDYTLEFTAVKKGGNEGFIIPFCVQTSQDFFHLNLGGWSNSVCCLEQNFGEYRSWQICPNNFKIENDREYNIKIVVSTDRIECYLDGKLVTYYDRGVTYDVYATASLDNDKLILKAVNASSDPVLVDLDLGEYTNGIATIEFLQSDDLKAMNTLEGGVSVEPRFEKIFLDSDFTLPPQSVNIITVEKQKN